MWSRSPEAFAILDSTTTGRMRILVIQLQGHLFFGNVAQFSDGVKKLIAQRKGDEFPLIIIMDLSLVIGIDSSAVQALIKLRDAFRKQFHIKLSIFVPGSEDGFPCEYDLFRGLECDENALSTKAGHGDNTSTNKNCSHACENLDLALIYAEDTLISMANPNLKDDKVAFPSVGDEPLVSIEHERHHALQLFQRQCPADDALLVETFFSYFNREVYKKGDVLWRQGTLSDCAKLLVKGFLISKLENEAGTTETVSVGNFIGESGLVNGESGLEHRTSTVYVLEDDTILYSLSRDAWNRVKEEDPKCAYLLYAIVVRYLTLRVQHVSNRIFETRCLPI